MHDYYFGWISLQRPMSSPSLLLKALVLTFTLVYILTSFMPELLKYGDLSHAAITGEYWRFFTSLFLHGSLPHLLFNTLALCALARLAEQFYSVRDWFITFVVGGIVGGLITLHLVPDAHVVGASPGIFALFAMCAAPQIRAIWADLDELWSLQQQVVLRSWIYVLVLNVVLGFVIPNIGWQAHAGGLIAGLVLGMLLPVQGKLTLRVSRPGIVQAVGIRTLRRPSSEMQLAQISLKKAPGFDDEQDFLVLLSERFGLNVHKYYKVEYFWGNAEAFNSSALAHSHTLAEPGGFRDELVDHSLAA